MFLHAWMHSFGIPGCVSVHANAFRTTARRGDPVRCHMDFEYLVPIGTEDPAG